MSLIHTLTASERLTYIEYLTRTFVTLSAYCDAPSSKKDDLLNNLENLVMLLSDDFYADLANEEVERMDPVVTN